MATKKSKSSISEVPMITLLLGFALVVETFWLLLFIFSDGTPIPPAVSQGISRAFSEKTKPTPKPASDTFADLIRKTPGPAQSGTDSPAAPKAKDTAPAKSDAARPASAAKPAVPPSSAAPALPKAPASSARKTDGEGKIDGRDEQDLQNLLAREGSKGKSSPAK